MKLGYLSGHYFQSFGFFDSWWILCEFLFLVNPWVVFGFSFLDDSCWLPSFSLILEWCWVINPQKISSLNPVVLRHYLNWVIFSGVHDLLVVASSRGIATENGNASLSHSGCNLKMVRQVSYLNHSHFPLIPTLSFLTLIRLIRRQCHIGFRAGFP